jgi:serine protease Do
MGALVVQVAPEGPAGKGGVQDGDIILEFNGQEINRSGELPPLVGQVRPGDKARMIVLRAGSRKSLSITIEELPDSRAKVANKKTQPSDQIGLKVAELTDSQKQRLGVKQGVIIADVESGSAARSGFRTGDVITMIGSQQVDNLDDYRQAVSLLKSGHSVPVRIVRQGEPAFIPLKVE